MDPVVYVPFDQMTPLINPLIFTQSPACQYPGSCSLSSADGTPLPQGFVVNEFSCETNFFTKEPIETVTDVALLTTYTLEDGQNTNVTY